MHRFLVGGLLSAALAFGLATTAGAAAPGVMQSGDVYHKNVCSMSVANMHAYCHAHIVTDAAGSPIANTKLPVGGFGPADLRKAYKVTKKGNSTTIIAIVDAFGYNNADSDLATYRSNFGLPACTGANGCFHKFNQNGVEGSYPAQNIGWAQESALDLDMASAMCWNCKLYLVEATTNSFNNLAAAEVTAHNLGAHVISNSYGGGEGGTQSLEGSYNFANTAVTASTGDDAFAAGPQFPATSPHVTAVGGTHLIKDGSTRGWTETVWHGAGSGCSTVYAKPSWQKDTGCAKRMEADVSAVADPATGVAVFGPNSSGNGTWLIFGGTSVSAPLIGGIYGVNGGTVNSAQKAYKKAALLNDVTAGNNGTCSPTYFCTGVVGYDGPTGLGTPGGIKPF